MTHHDDRAKGSSHLDMGELLALRDGSGSDAASEHLRVCPACRQEVERLHQVRARLKALPSQGPPRDLWPRLSERISEERRSRRDARLLRLALTGAAAVLIALAVPSLLERRQQTIEHQELETALVDLQERSQLLDGELRSLRGRSLSAWRAEAIVYLEDELDEVDTLLREMEEGGDGPASGERVALWLSRLELQSALVELHAAPVTRVEL